MVSAIAPTARVNMKPPESTLVSRESDSPRGRKLNLHESTQSPAVHRPTVSSLHHRRAKACAKCDHRAHAVCSTALARRLRTRDFGTRDFGTRDFGTKDLEPRTWNQPGVSSLSFFTWRLAMQIHGEITDELRGDGMIIIEGRDVALVPYSLTLATEPGRLVGEGSICGPELLLR